MPDYNAYNAWLTGFITGRKLAREDRQYKQEQEGRSGLGQLLKQDYEKDNPGSAVPNFGNMDTASQIAIVNYAKQKRKEIDEQEKLEISRGIDILRIGTEAASKSKGDVQRHLTKQAWGAALPILQKHGYFKDFDIKELEKKLNMADDKTVSSFIKRTSAVSEALEAKTISTAEANKMTNQILVETIESIEDPNERKPVTDEITRIRKGLEPEKPEKEVNIANDIDTVLGGMFPGYYTDKKVREQALAYYSTPQGAKAVQAAAAAYQRSKAAPINVFVPTSEGIVPANVRTGQMGAPAKAPDGATYSKPTPAGEITPLQQVKTLTDAIDTAEKLYDPDFVGPATGRIAALGRMVAGGAGQSEKQIVFNAALEQARNTLVYLLSGKQINETEYARLEKQLPSSTLMPNAFKANLKEFKRTLTSILENKQKTLKSGGYGGGETSPATKSAKTVVKKFVSPSTGKTKLIYSDGTEEIR